MVTLLVDVEVVFLPLTVLVMVCFKTSLQVAVLEGATNFEPEILQPPDVLHLSFAPRVGLMRDVREDVEDEEVRVDDTLYVGFENVIVGTFTKIPATGEVTASVVNVVPAVSD